MEKKRVEEGSKAPSIRKKSSKTISSSTAPSSTKSTKYAYPLILPASTGRLHFASEEQKTQYEILTTRKTSEQKYSLQTLGMLDDMLSLMRKLGWMEYIDIQCTSYDRLMIEFLSSLNVN